MSSLFTVASKYHTPEKLKWSTQTQTLYCHFASLCCHLACALTTFCGLLRWQPFTGQVARNSYVRLKHFVSMTWVTSTPTPIDRDKEKPMMTKVVCTRTCYLFLWKYACKTLRCDTLMYAHRYMPARTHIPVLQLV